ncbi:MAG: helix-turn-helix domain-containing protein [Nitriliruptoraceae bacterium]
MRFSPEQISAFAARLADARQAAGLTRRDVVEAVHGISDPQQLYNYEKARRAPDRIEVVTGLEDALHLPIGTLCRMLGFEPFQTSSRKSGSGRGDHGASVEDAIASDQRLSRTAKDQLLSVYRRLAQSGSPTHRP